MKTLTYEKIAQQLCDGLNKTREELSQAEYWLASYAIANQLSLNELNRLCQQRKNQILNEIF